MKARITHLKAPWPLGARVGDVVELGSEPAWAVGKFEKVGDDEPVTLEFGEPVKVVLEGDSAEVQALKAEVADLTAKLDEAGALALMAQEQSESIISGLNEQMAAAKAEAEAAKATAADLTSQVADLTAKLKAATTKTGSK
jgi:hypothetical protein